MNTASDGLNLVFCVQNKLVIALYLILAFHHYFVNLHASCPLKEQIFI